MTVDTGWFLRFLGISPWFFFGWMNMILAKALFIYFGIRRGLELRTVISLALAYTVGAAAGAFFLNSIMAVLFGGALFFMIFSRFLSVSREHSDLLAINFAAAVGIGRFGCLFSGCCFGSPTTLPWGIHYGSGSIAQQFHLQMQWLPAGAGGSLAVHPLPLYESMFLLTAVVMMSSAGNRWPSMRKYFLPLMLSSYFFFRTFIEPIRDHYHSQSSISMIGPVSVFQVLLLLGLLVCTIWMLLIHRFPEKNRSDAPARSRHIIILLMSITTLFLLRRRIHSVQYVQILVLTVFSAAAAVFDHIRQTFSQARFSRNPDPGLPVFGRTAALAVTLLFFSGILVMMPAEQTAAQKSDKYDSGISIMLADRTRSKLISVSEQDLDRYVSEFLNGGDAGASENDESEENVSRKITLEGGYMELETCDGIERYHYGGFSFTGEKVNNPASEYPVSTAAQIGFLVVGGDGGTLLIPGGGMMVSKKWPTVSAGIGMHGGAVGDTPVVLPGAFIRFGDNQQGLSFALNDYHNDFAGLYHFNFGYDVTLDGKVRHSAGLTNFLFMPAMYYRRQYDDRSWTFLFWPRQDNNESMGLGVRYSRAVQ